MQKGQIIHLPHRMPKKAVQKAHKNPKKTKLCPLPLGSLQLPILPTRIPNPVKIGQPGDRYNKNPTTPLAMHCHRENHP